MSDRLEMNSIAHHASEILTGANLVYWLSNSPVDLDAAAYHEKNVVYAFEKIAGLLGYRIEKMAAAKQEAA